MDKKYFIGYKDDYLVFGHGDDVAIRGIRPIDIEEARRAVILLPSEGEVILYELIPVKTYPADVDKRAAVAREESHQSAGR